MAEEHNHYNLDPEFVNATIGKQGNLQSLQQCKGEEGNDVQDEEQEQEQEQEIEDVGYDGQQKIERALTLISRMNSTIDQEDIAKNPEKNIRNIDCLTAEQQDYLVLTMKNLEEMMVELHSAIIKYGIQEQVTSQLKNSLQTSNVLLFQLRSIISAFHRKSVPDQVGEKVQNQQGEEIKENNESTENIEKKEINLQMEEQKEQENNNGLDDKEFFITVTNRDQINVGTFFVGAKVLNTYLEEIKNICLNILAPKLKKKLQSYLNDHKIVQAKLNTITEFIPFAVIFDKNDIFALDQDEHYVWKLLKQHIEYTKLAPQEDIKKQFKAIVKAVLLGNAMAAKGAERKSKLGQWLQRNLSAVYYLCCPSTSQRKAEIFFSNPDQKTAISVNS